MKKTDVCCQPDEREASATGECPGLWDNGHLGSSTLRVTGEKAQPLPGCCLLSAQELGPLGNLLYLSDRYIYLYISKHLVWTLRKKPVCSGTSSSKYNSLKIYLSWWEILNAAVRVGSFSRLVRALSGGDELGAGSLSFVDSLSAVIIKRSWWLCS